MRPSGVSMEVSSEPVLRQSSGGPGKKGGTDMEGSLGGEAGGPAWTLCAVSPQGSGLALGTQCRLNK